jgi:hypothetical protein
MKIRTCVLLLLAGLLLTPAGVWADDGEASDPKAPPTETGDTPPQDAQAEPPFAPLDFRTVERKIRKAPTFNAEPLYALFIFGPQAKTRIWAALDKTNTEYDYYDVLYFDRNGDGDLTQEGERIVGVFDEARAAAGLGLVLSIGDFAVPGTALVHKKLRVSTIRKPGRTGIWFDMRYDGKTQVSGGMRCNGSCTAWGKTIEEAPILRPTIRGPLTFGFYGWGASEIQMTIGESRKVYLILGNRGSGTDTLCAVDEDFLSPTTDKITYTLIAKDENGKPITSEGTIPEHC